MLNKVNGCRNVLTSYMASEHSLTVCLREGAMDGVIAEGKE